MVWMSERDWVADFSIMRRKSSIVSFLRVVSTSFRFSGVRGDRVSLGEFQIEKLVYTEAKILIIQIFRVF